MQNIYYLIFFIILALLFTEKKGLGYSKIF